ncbi:MAG: glycosyltransferase, partial [Bacteroidales bacterium]|nr:glycosyltransferase [Bacteroidales bacterium]
MNNNQTIKISIVITTKNRLHLLIRALKSVLNQTYSNTEVIVIDDCSDISILDYLKALDNQIIYYRFDHSVGANTCRNKGAAISTGDYIAYLDDDDEWLPNKLVQQLKALNETKAEFCYTAKKILYSRENKIYKER